MNLRFCFKTFIQQPFLLTGCGILSQRYAVSEWPLQAGPNPFCAWLTNKSMLLNQHVPPMSHTVAGEVTGSDINTG